MRRELRIEHIESGPHPLHDGSQRTVGVGHLPVDLGADLIPIAQDDRGGTCGSGRTDVGDEIGDGEVGLVADCRDDGRAAFRYRSSDGFLVEGP